MKRTFTLAMTALFLLGFAAGVVVYTPQEAGGYVCSYGACYGIANCSPARCTYPDGPLCCGRSVGGGPCLPLDCNQPCTNPACLPIDP